MSFTTLNFLNQSSYSTFLFLLPSYFRLPLALQGGKEEQNQGDNLQIHHLQDLVHGALGPKTEQIVRS